MSLIKCKSDPKISRKLDKFLLGVKKDQDKRIKKLVKEILNPSLTKEQVENLVLKEFCIRESEQYFLFGDGGK